MGKYDDYVEECQQDGVEPLLFDTWKAERMAEGRAAKVGEVRPDVAETKAVAKDEELEAQAREIAEIKAKLAALTAEPEPEIPTRPLEWGEDGVYRYYSNFKQHQIIRTPGRNLMVDGVMTTQDVVAVNFSDHQFSTEDKELADWLETKAMDKSVNRLEFGWHVFRTTDLTSAPVTQVTDGPKTSIPQQTHRYQDRPSPLHANA